MTSQRQTLTDTPITISERGTGQTVLLLHGGGGPESIPGLMAALAADHRVLMPTHPGWHGTARPHGLHSVKKLADAYLHLLHDRGEGNVIVVGSSFGGWIAAEMAAETDPIITGLILVDSVGIEPAPAHIPVADDDTRWAAPNAGQSPEAFSAIRAYTGAQMWDTTLAARLQAISVPALVVWGEHDPVLTPDYGRALTAAIPGAHFRLIDDAGHLPSEEQPEATTSVIRAFMQTIEGDR